MFLMFDNKPDLDISLASNIPHAVMWNNVNDVNHSEIHQSQTPTTNKQFE